MITKHRAAFYHHIGVTVDAPADPAPAIDPEILLDIALATYRPAETRECPRCHGCGKVQNDYWMRYDDCPRCVGAGNLPIVHQV